jgi:uncharacterized protein
MKKVFTDWKFLLGLLLANALIYFAYDQSKVFWYILTGSMLFLISYSILNEDVDDRITLGQYLLYGLLSGVALYVIFWIGNFLINGLNITVLADQVTKIYKKFAPEVIWHYIALVLVIIPGEEFFWRGFVQKRLLANTGVWPSIIISTLFYSIVSLYSGYIVLAITALICGFVWGFLYAWKRSLPLVIISHITFNLLLLVFFPLV